MTSTRSWMLAAFTAASLALGWPALGLSQDKPKDEGLEKLLEKLEEKDKADPAKDKDKDKDKEKDKEKKPGEVAPKDQELDKLLEGLGQTKDTPAPDDKKPGGPGSEPPPPPKGDQPKPDDLKGADKDLDRELERITGKKPPKSKEQRDKEKKEEEGGPLGQVIKEMRDVEERLGKPDTGEETRKKQTEIVKGFDQLIEQMKNAPSQSMAMKMMRGGKKPGPPQQPGQPGNQPGAMAQGPPPSKPSDPSKKKTSLPDELAKSIWGQLPAQFREEMGNVLNEHPLPTREELIKLYYMSLGNKNAGKEE